MGFLFKFGVDLVVVEEGVGEQSIDPPGNRLEVLDLIVLDDKAAVEVLGLVQDGGGVV